MLKKIGLMFLGLFLLISITGCKEEEKYTITFEPNNGENPTTIVVNKNSIITKPFSPEREGFEFLGWFLDDATFEQPFNDESLNNQSFKYDFVVYARWSEVDLNPDILPWILRIISTEGGTTNPHGEIEVERDEAILIEAIHFEGYTFSHWMVRNGEAQMEDPQSSSTQLLVQEDGTVIEAIFAEKEKMNYVLMIETTPGGSVTQLVISEEEDEMEYQVSAIPDTHFTFSHWEVLSGEAYFETQESTTLVRTSSVTTVIKAHFEETPSLQTWPLTVISTHGGNASEEGSWWLEQGAKKSFSAHPTEEFYFSHWEVLAGNATATNMDNMELEIQMNANEFVVQAVFIRRKVEVEIINISIQPSELSPNEDLNIEVDIFNKGNVDLNVDLVIELRSPNGEVYVEELIQNAFLEVSKGISISWTNPLLEDVQDGDWDVSLSILGETDSQERQVISSTGWILKAFQVNNPLQRYDVLLISTAAVSVNIRSGPGTSYAVVGALPRDALAPYVRKVNDQWFETIYLQEKAYISTLYSELYYFEKASEEIEEIIDFGKTLIGAPYVYGAQRYHWGPPNANRNSNFVMGLFDCSSFTQYIFYISAGIVLDVTTRTQIVQGTHVPLDDLKRGDLMFFTNSTRQHHVGIERVGHVAIYLGNNYILHTSSNVATIEPISQARWNYYIESRRIVK